MTQEELNEWKRLADEASAGPWSVEWNWKPIVVWNDGDRFEAWCEGPTHKALTLEKAADVALKDAAFIAAAREAIPALIAEVERLRNAK